MLGVVMVAGGGMACTLGGCLCVWRDYRMGWKAGGTLKKDELLLAINGELKS